MTDTLTPGSAAGGSTVAPGPVTPPDDTAARIRAVLDGPWAPLRETIRAAADPQVHLAPPGESVPQARERVLRQLTTLAEQGHGREGFPPAQGGTLDYGSSCVAFEMQAYGDLSLLVKTGVQFGLFGGAIARLGSERHRQAYLPDVMDGRLLGSFAMTEVGHGSNVARLETTATWDPQTRDLVVHTPTPSSTKTYIGNAARDARMAVVFAQLVTAEGTHGVHAVLVPVRDEAGEPMPGVTVGDNGAKAGLPGVDNGTLAFDRVHVPLENLLDAHGSVDEQGRYSSPIENPNRRFFTMLGTLVRGRVCVGGASVSAAKKALVIALRYGDRRRQFEAPGGEQEVVVLDYLAHQRKLLPRLATTYALSLAQNQVVETLEALHGHDAPAQRDQEAQRELETRVAGLKAVSTWFSLDTIQTCREACGGAGYLAENQLSQMRADVDVFTTFEGDNTVLLQLVAKGLLTEYKEMWGDLDQTAMVQMVSRQVAEGLVERTTGRAGLQRLLDLAKRRDDTSALTDRGWQLSMFEQRADHTLANLGQRLRRATPENGFELFNNAQDHVLFAARTHVDRVVMEAFAEAVDAMEPGEARDLTDAMCSLYALSSIEQDKAWFLEHGRLSTARSRAVTAQVNELCRRLRPQVHTLVDALGVPEALITAPIVTQG